MVIIIRPKNRSIPSGIISTQYPINLGYISSWLKKNGIDVVILDFEVEKSDNKRLINLIKDKNPILIGVSCTTSNVKSGHKIAECVKRIYPDLPIVIGGVHASALPERTLKEFSSFDIVAKGEGEETLLELYNAIRENEDLAKVRGLVYRDNNGNLIDTGTREVIQDLDKLPFPDRENLNMSLYKKTHVTRGISRLNRNVAEILTARGCPYDCIFCASKVAMGKPVRYRSVNNIISEIEECITKYSVDHFSVLDDTFTFREDILYQVCDYFKSRRVSWDCLTRLDRVSEVMIKKMVDSGCEKISFGVESGSEKILKIIGKDVTIAQIKEIFKFCKKSGLRYLEASFMLGNHPLETKEEVRSTLDLAIELDPDIMTVSIAVPFPGTELNRLMKERNYLGRENWDEFVLFGSSPSWKYEYLDLTTLKGLQSKLYKRFYWRFSYILKQLKKLRSFKELNYWLEIAFNMFRAV